VAQVEHGVATLDGVASARRASSVDTSVAGLDADK
jgi:hypothetical protein